MDPRPLDPSAEIAISSQRNSSFNGCLLDGLDKGPNALSPCPGIRLLEQFLNLRLFLVPPLLLIATPAFRFAPLLSLPLTIDSFAAFGPAAPPDAPPP